MVVDRECEKDTASEGGTSEVDDDGERGCGCKIACFVGRMLESSGIGAEVDGKYGEDAVLSVEEYSSFDYNMKQLGHDSPMQQYLQYHANA